MVVDVLSFSTSVMVAVEAGMRVFPYAWRDETAVAFARQKAAEPAEGGFAEDVAIAVELNASGLVPVLTQGTFDASPEKWRGSGGR
ncbi:hypothetical protein AB0H03_26200 [Streptomyces sparsogenes]|uniref:hypothetical protein n=1 Tax=Streptomyces sparsogenes TaxID=67365 RepID=UPI0033FFC3DB